MGKYGKEVKSCDYDHLMYIDFPDEKIKGYDFWISFLIENIRIGFSSMKGFPSGTIIDDFYYNEINFKKKDLIYISKLANTDNEGKILAKELILAKLNVNEDEFIKKSLKRFTRKKR